MTSGVSSAVSEELGVSSAEADFRNSFTETPPKDKTLHEELGASEVSYEN